MTRYDPFSRRTWKLAHGQSVETGPAAVIMGILNVTPDSFSDGGLHIAVDDAVRRAREMAGEGATIIDIGGESTRPGADAVDALEEQRRVLPVIEALAGTGMILSIDTWRTETAKLAVDAGAHIINDIWGLHRDGEKARIAAETGAGLVIMHNGRERDRDPDVIRDQCQYLGHSLEVAATAGVPADQIMLDPGFGFAKDPEENIALMARFGELHGFGLPFLIGTSRKRFLGGLTGRDAAERDAATAATSVALRLAGGAVFRVHDVAMNRDALLVADAIVQSGGRQGREDP